jgi:hypothetical protein
VLAALVGVLLILRIINAYDAAPLVPLVAVIVLLVWRLTSDDPARPRAMVWGALLLLGFSFGLHAVVAKVDSLGSAGDSWASQIESMLKHSAELAGWMLLAIGVTALAAEDRSQETAGTTTDAAPYGRPPNKIRARRIGPPRLPAPEDRAIRRPGSLLQPFHSFRAQSSRLFSKPRKTR